MADAMSNPVDVSKLEHMLLKLQHHDNSPPRWLIKLEFIRLNLG